MWITLEKIIKENMIDGIKCYLDAYNLNDKDYKNYGAIGITVDPRWHSFENYLSDIQSLPIYGNIESNRYQIDIPKEQRVYSKDTYIILNNKDNSDLKLIDNSDSKVNNYYGVYKSGNYYYPTIMHNGIKYHLGIYDNEIAEANAYNYYYTHFNTENNCFINTINDVEYIDIKEFSKYNKKPTLIPVYKLK